MQQKLDLPRYKTVSRQKRLHKRRNRRRHAGRRRVIGLQSQHPVLTDAEIRRALHQLLDSFVAEKPPVPRWQMSDRPSHGVPGWLQAILGLGTAMFLGLLTLGCYYGSKPSSNPDGWFAAGFMTFAAVVGLFVFDLRRRGAMLRHVSRVTPPQRRWVVMDLGIIVLVLIFIPVLAIRSVT